MEKKPFAELGLSPEILKAVARMGFEEARRCNRRRFLSC